MAESPATNRIRTRVMNRALARLRNLHRAEYEALLEEELAYAEAKDHIARVRREHPDEPPPARESNLGGPHPKPPPPFPAERLDGVA